MEQINKLFVQFLKDNNVLKQYIKNIKRLKKNYFLTWENHTNLFTIQPLEQCLNNAREIDIIDDSFLWMNTLEGHTFWSVLNTKWRNFYRSHNNNLNR